MGIAADSRDVSVAHNPVLELIEARTSTRSYAPTPIADAEKRAILHASLRAPTAGNQVAYSIIDIQDPAVKARLAQTCDDQPFIAEAPWVLVFVADHQKWIDLYRWSGLGQETGGRPLLPGLGELLMAFSDALIAAQNAVIAAESLGIGSCYIGDIIENAEVHAELLGLPNHAMPAAMLCFGRPAAKRPPSARFEGNLVHVDRYHSSSDAELAQASRELARTHLPHGLPDGCPSYGEYVYRRKFDVAYQREMNRSAGWWIRRWESPSQSEVG